MPKIIEEFEFNQPAKLGVTHIAVLEVLAKVRGGMSVVSIQQHLGYKTPGAVQRTVGYIDEEARKKQDEKGKCLLTLGFVKATHLHDDCINEIVYEITDAGRKELETTSSTPLFAE